MAGPREVTLVTGAMGCIGAWTVRHLVEQGKRVVAFDLSERRHRLDLLIPREKQAAITFVHGDLTDFTQVLGAFRAHAVTRVIHLAAFQVPLCKADPVAGSRVNVTGTVNVFEAARQTSLRHVTYASSIAVYGPPADYPPGLIAHDAALSPRTLYGVYKQANEWTARIYAQDHFVSSTALRPYTVYGVGRDQGLTSDPTKAMLAAAGGRSHHIGFGGVLQFQLASDVALQFIEAAERPLEGAHCFNLGTPPASVSQVVSIIRRVKPEASITCGDEPLPFPEGFDDRELRRHFTRVFETPLEQGIRETIEHFEACLAGGRLAPPL